MVGYFKALYLENTCEYFQNCKVTKKKVKINFSITLVSSNLPHMTRSLNVDMHIYLVLIYI